MDGLIGHLVPLLPGKETSSGFACPPSPLLKEEWYAYSDAIVPDTEEPTPPSSVLPYVHFRLLLSPNEAWKDKELGLAPSIEAPPKGIVPSLAPVAVAVCVGPPNTGSLPRSRPKRGQANLFAVRPNGRIPASFPAVSSGLGKCGYRRSPSCGRLALRTQKGPLRERGRSCCLRRHDVVCANCQGHRVSPGGVVWWSCLEERARRA